MEVALGGTFDPIHDGHRKLFERAFEIGDVTVGLTSDKLAPQTRHRDRYIRPFDERRQLLAQELEDFALRFNRSFAIRELTSPTGIATEPQFDVLVVSPETKEGGEQINAIRQKQGFEPLEIVVVEHLLAEDGDIISSTRIVNGEIDEHGNVVTDTPGRQQVSDR